MSEKLKIAFYTDAFYPAVDGVVISIMNFDRQLTKLGHEVTIFASGDSKTRSLAKKKSNLHVVRGIKFKKYPQYALAFFPFVDPAKFFMSKFDVVHSQTPFFMGVSGMLMAKANRIPLASTFHTMFTDKRVVKDYAVKNKFLTKHAAKYSWSYARFFYKKCDAVIAPSMITEHVLNAHKIHKTVVVPNSIDLKLFNDRVDGSQVRSRFLRSDNQKLVLYVGRLSKEKRIDTLIKAARLLKSKNIKFLLVGDGPAEEYYKKMAASYNLSDTLKFVGRVENRSLAAYYSAADIFCIPSTFETQGIVSVEAMACGTPVVGANYLALKELIKNNKNGEKFRPGDSKDCARKIEKVINNIGTYKDMVSTAKRFSIERTTDELLNVYRQIIEQKTNNQ